MGRGAVVMGFTPYIWYASSIITPSLLAQNNTLKLNYVNTNFLDELLNYNMSLRIVNCNIISPGFFVDGRTKVLPGATGTQILGIVRIFVRSPGCSALRGRHVTFGMTCIHPRYFMIFYERDL